MTTLTTDAHLVADFLSGDKSALAAIYDRYAPGLYDTARAMLSDRHDAADMVQDVFCIAAERLGQLREPDRLKPWLYSVLRHEVYRRTKKRKRAVPVDFQDEGTPDVASGYDPHEAGEAIAHEELASLVRSAASGLDERDRLVLELSVRQGLAGADLADALGVTPEQSYSLVHRMRDRVEKSLGALTVAKAGRRDCSQLAQILSGWDGELTILLRKRVNRHIEECATCDRTRKKYAPLALFGAAPVFAMPFGLRERVLAAAIPGGSGSASTDSNGPGDSGSSSSSTPSTTSRNIRFDAHKGFPRAARAGRHLVAWAAAATTVAVVGGGVLVATVGDDGDSGGSSGVASAVVVDATDATEILPSSDDRQIVSGSGSVIQIFGDDESPAEATPTSDGSIGGAGDPASGPPPPASVPESSTPTTSPSVVPVVPPTDAPTTSEAAKATPSSSTTEAPVVVQSIQVSSTKLDFGANSTAVKVVVFNPNSFPVSFATAVSSSKFTTSPTAGTLAAGEQASLTVTFDRTGAEADTKNFPTGSFSHSLTFTTSESSGSSSPTRTATMYGTIERATATTTATTISVNKVAGVNLQCSNVGLRAEVTTNGKIAAGSVLGGAQFQNLNGKTIGTSPTLTMTQGVDGLWRATTPLPLGTTKVLIKVTAETTTGQSAVGSATLSTAC
ncbi:MAG: sigma-70 family RNA polymerase sigma factor, partial [Ilumatobacteraceae bacterium]